MKVLRLLVIASIISCAVARVVGPQVVASEARKITKPPQSKQEDDEGVIVDPVITVSDIQVYEASTNAPTATSSEQQDNSQEVTSSTSAESSTEVVNIDDANPINRYCKCTSYECDCCRDFSLPIVPIRGPGCANIRYLEGDRLSIGIKFGNRVLANRVISGRKATPVCLPMPGGLTNFCGRIYGISKKNEDFKACLGLELRAEDEVEAALRVSCFSFGPRGLKVMEAEPIPIAPAEEDEDDDDIFGLGGTDSEDEDDDDGDILGDDEEDDTPTGQSAGVVNQSVASNDDDDDDDDDDDYTGLSLLSGDIFDDLLGDDGDSDSKPVPSKKSTKKKKKPVSDLDNEVDAALSDDDDDDSQTRPAGSNNDDDESEEESGGILEILDDLISDGEEEDDDEDEKIEDEVSEEIAENELDDAAEDVVEEVDETTLPTEKVSEDENLDRDEQVLTDSLDDDDDDDEKEYDEEDDDDKPTAYTGLSLLGLRNFFSRYFK